MIDIPAIADMQQAPQPFTPGEARFWTDPHIARQMLAAHLDVQTDAASRKPETIRATCEWIIRTLDLRPGSAVLDLGCGPGLYAAELARRGMNVTGVDFSENSIAYAVQQARDHHLPISYRCQDYLELDDEQRYDAALLIYGDYCPLSPQQRAQLLKNVQRALKPGGRFVFDVTTPHLRATEGLKNGWYCAANGGFWKPGPHLVLEQGFAYPGDIYLDQYIVVEADGKTSVYRNWFQDFTPQHLRQELEAQGWQVEGMWNDLTGASLAEDADWIGIIARVKN